MTIDEIFAAAGIPARETLWVNPPGGAFAAWGEEINASGSDFGNEIYERRYSVELFEPRDMQSPEAHRALQRVLDDEAIPFRKSTRIFYEDIQYFCTTYEFNMTERMIP